MDRLCQRTHLRSQGFLLLSWVAALMALVVAVPSAVAQPITADAVFELPWEDSLTITPKEVVAICSTLLADKEHQPPSSIEKAYQARALAYHRLGELQAAKGDYDELVKRRPRDNKVKCMRALTLGALGLTEQAVKEVREISRQAPDYAMAHVVLAMLIGADGAADRTQAIRHATTAISLQPKDPLGYYI